MNDEKINISDVRFSPHIFVYDLEVKQITEYIGRLIWGNMSPYAILIFGVNVI